MVMADAMQPKTSAGSTAVSIFSRSRRRRACVEREDAVTKWGKPEKWGKAEWLFRVW